MLPSSQPLSFLPEQGAVRPPPDASLGGVELVPPATPPPHPAPSHRGHGAPSHWLKPVCVNSLIQNQICPRNAFHCESLDLNVDRCNS